VVQWPLGIVQDAAVKHTFHPPALERIVLILIDRWHSLLCSMPLVRTRLPPAFTIT
jgi:hypothetical protein